MQIIILTIDDHGRTRAYVDNGSHVTPDELPPVRSGDDRGHYDVFEVAGVSIDVMRPSAHRVIGGQSGRSE